MYLAKHTKLSTCGQAFNWMGLGTEMEASQLQGELKSLTVAQVQHARGRSPNEAMGYHWLSLVSTEPDKSSGELDSLKILQQGWGS